MKPLRKKAALYTLGCRANQAESTAIANELLKNGFDLVNFKDAADVYIINSCTVTGNADKKTRNILRQALKRKNAQVIITGCLVESAPKLKELIPGNYSITDNKAKPKILKTLKLVSPLPTKRTLYKVRSNLLIENGCENYCAYCIVPLVRGKVKSIALTKAVEQAQKLIAAGTKEIVLTGINLGAYGTDLPDKANLISVIQAIAALDGVERVRLSSIEPQYVTKALLKEIKTNDKVCKHLHLPLQSGDNQILKAMNRKYTAEKFVRLCQNARRQIKNLVITTDIIVGLPGETKKAFRNTVKLIKQIGFERIHIFSFSARPKTTAAKMKNQIDKTTIKQRAVKLKKLRAQLMKKFSKKYLNKTVSILVEEYHPKDKTIEGLTGNFLRVKAKGTPKLLGKIAKVKIIKASEDYCLGKIV